MENSRFVITVLSVTEIDSSKTTLNSKNKNCLIWAALRFCPIVVKLFRSAMPKGVTVVCIYVPILL